MSGPLRRPNPPSVHVLGNGVRVVCDPMPGLETLALSVVAGRGARWEDEARSGWSHLLEHMVFKGAGRRSARDIVEAIEGQGGQINAATGYERTSFQVRALAGGLDLALSVVADLVLRPTLQEADLAREKQVVGQEIAEACDTPDDLIFELAQEAAFEGQPLGRSILGTVETIGRATPGALADWRAGLYAPASLVVSVAGAVDEDELLALAEREFGAAAGDGLAGDPTPGAFTPGARSVAKRLEQANLVLLMPAPGVADPDYFTLRLICEILGGGMASRLFQEARERRGLAYAVDAYAETYAEVGVLGVFAGCAAADGAELARVAAGEILGLTRAIGEGELARAKAQLKSGIFMGRESPAVRAEQAASQLLVFGRPLSPADSAARIDEATPGDLRRLMGHILDAGHCAAAVLGPRPAFKAAEAFRRGLFG